MRVITVRIGNQSYQVRADHNLTITISPEGEVTIEAETSQLPEEVAGETRGGDEGETTAPPSSELGEAIGPPQPTETWTTAKFRGCWTVKVKTDHKGAYILNTEGRACIRYRDQDTKTYDANPANVIPFLTEEAYKALETDKSYRKGLNDLARRIRKPFVFETSPSTLLEGEEEVTSCDGCADPYPPRRIGISRVALSSVNEENLTSEDPMSVGKFRRSYQVARELIEDGYISVETNIEASRELAL